MSIQPISAENQVAKTRTWRFSKVAAEPVEIPFTVEQIQVIERAAGGLLVLGGPGSGKSEVIAAAVAERLNSGVSSESILVLTFDHAAAAVLKQGITLKTGGGISPAITTFHSFALSLFNEFNSHSEPPTLITASAQEVLLKELIEGILDEPLLAQRFRIQPEHVNMLRTKAMLVDIRNAIARAQVLGLTPTELSDIAANDPNWQLIADIYREYLNQLMLEHVIDYNQLVTEVTSMLRDDAIRARLQARFQAIYIDEYQDIDPLYVGILREVINPAGLVVAAANPDQAVYQFRGAEDSAVLTFEDDFSHLLNGVSVTKLNQNFRSNQKLQTACDLLIERNSDFPLLKKYGLTTRGLKALAPEESMPAIKVQGYESAEAEAESIASQIREIVLSSDSNLTWSDIAILVRTGSSSIPVLQQALAAADVPVSVVFDEVPLAEENVVRLLLTALEIAHAPSRLKEPHIARDLLTSPFANMSPTELRHLGRELKRSVRLPGTFSEQLVADALADRDFDIEPGDARAKDLLRRVRNLHELFYAVHNASRKGTPVAELLWKLWTDQCHDWPNQLRSKALASGYSAAVANHSLDAIRTLFKVASDTAAAVKSHTSIPNFIAELKAMEVASQKTVTAVPPNAVAVMTAHRAKGKQWPVVFVASVDEGRWPDVTRRTSILSPDRLTRDGLGFLPERYEVVADERRLLYTAATRAKSVLRISHTAADPDSGRVASRFLKPLMDLDGASFSATNPNFEGQQKAFSASALVAQLRRIAIDTSQSHALREAATSQIIKLAQLKDKNGRLIAPAAHPAAWWGIAPFTENSRPIVAIDEPVYVRGSSFADLLNCPLNWFMKQQAAADVGGSVAANFGSVVHALAAGVVDGEIANNEVEIAAKLDEHWAALRYSATWESKVQKTEAIRCIRNFLIWRDSRLPELSKTQKAEYSESFFDSDIDFPMPDGTVEKIKLRGSIDILQVQADGQIFIADIKTSTSIASKKDAETNPQLGVYQKAVELGLINLAEVDVAQSLQSAGAALLFVRDKTKSAGPSVRIQSPLAQAETDWMDQNFAVAIEVVRKEIHTPIVSKSCTYCPVKSSCPTQAEGKSVI